MTICAPTVSCIGTMLEMTGFMAGSGSAFLQPDKSMDAHTTHEHTRAMGVNFFILILNRYNGSGKQVSIDPLNIIPIKMRCKLQTLLLPAGRRKIYVSLLFLSRAWIVRKEYDIFVQLLKRGGAGVGGYFL